MIPTILSAEKCDIYFTTTAKELNFYLVEQFHFLYNEHFCLTELLAWL